MPNKNKLIPRYRQASATALLLLCLAALVFGVFGAVYLQRPGAPPPVASREAAPPVSVATIAPVPQLQPAAPPQPAPPLPNMPSAAAPGESAATTPSPPSAPAAPEKNKTQELTATTSPNNAAAAPAPSASLSPPAGPPASGAPATTTAAMPPLAQPEPAASELARIAPTAAPAAIAATTSPRYWVEFGAYRSTRYAEKLQQNLKSLGIASVITQAPGRGNRIYLRVRTAGFIDRASAEAGRTQAARTLGIVPLLHGPASAPPAASPAVKNIASKPDGYWVQFGAYRNPAAAQATARTLRKSNVHVSVIKRKNPHSAAPLFLIRATGLAGRADAESLARRGSAALGQSDFLVGQSVHREGLHGRGPPG